MQYLVTQDLTSHITPRQIENIYYSQGSTIQTSEIRGTVPKLRLFATANYRKEH